MNNENKKPIRKGSEISRRQFLGKSAMATAGFMIVPRHVLGGPGQTAPSDLLNIGCVGVGGKGSSDIRSLSSENIIALCDVDDIQTARFLKSRRNTPEKLAMYEKAGKYRDFRVMLEKEKSIDAITVSTPDHNHAVIAMMAIKMGKHVFVQKPLTHTIKEARFLEKAAKEHNIVSQMGNQGHAGEGARLINEWIWDGAIGDVREAHVWTNRPIWPQGINAPKEIPSVPSTLDWNIWLGPAPFRPYHPAYAPFNWRGWWDFGTGVVGDMGAHLMDPPFWALKLGHPTSVQSSSTRFTRDSYPLAEMVTYEFPARENMVPVKLTWYDGGLMPPPGRRISKKAGRWVTTAEVFYLWETKAISCAALTEKIHASYRKRTCRPIRDRKKQSPDLPVSMKSGLKPSRQAKNRQQTFPMRLY